jgi:hypothetical protein
MLIGITGEYLADPDMTRFLGSFWVGGDTCLQTVGASPFVGETRPRR